LFLEDGLYSGLNIQYRTVLSGCKEGVRDLPRLKAIDLHKSHANVNDFIK